jgi:glycosyltransferase involved in cell wall biosynthesis
MILTTAVLMFFRYIMWRDNEKNDVDLIHSHGHFGIWIYLYRNILKRIHPGAWELKTPLVVHFHNTVEGRQQALESKDAEVKPVSKYLDWPLAKLSDKWAVKAADACIFVSEATKEDAVKFYGADPSKCYVVESGVNILTFKPVGQEEFEKTRRDLGLDTWDKVVLNQGAMLERKNIHLLVEALKFLPADYKLLLVGTGDMEYLGRLRESAKKLQLENRVIMAGYTPYPIAPISFQASDIFVLPSSWEGFPKVVTQSLSCGVPVLASGFKAKDEIKGLHYLENLEPEHIANQIKQIVEDPDTQKVDTNFVYGHFSWETKARQVEAIYQTLRK